MARMVKCNATGIIGNSADFYRADNKWYQSENIYNTFIEEKSSRKNINLKIMDLLGYKDMLPSVLGGLIGKRIKESNFSNKELYELLVEKEDYIKELLDESDNHSDDVKRVLTIFTIISTIPQTITYGGCYKIQNLNTGEIYIGETLDMFQRMNQHISDLYSNIHHCKGLQNAFNESRDISNFKFIPIFLYEIKNKDKEKEKHHTLYLECAYYLKCKHNKISLYNTVNPYIALKEKSIYLENYNIDCDKVLELLLEDKQNILPSKIKEKLRKDLNQM